MSLYGALSIGVSGLSAFSQALSATSSNIANVNTVGYKEATSSFSTFLNAESGVGNNSSAGVVSTVGQDVTTQGLPTTTSSTTDMSISGNGFFVVATDPTATATQEYTRAGSFLPDQNGNLVNTAGLYLLGYKLDSAGNVPNNASSLSPINITGLSGTAGASTKMSLQANLDASATVKAYNPGDMAAGNVPADFNRTINVYDSQGGQQPVMLSFVKTGANTFNYEATYAGAAGNVSSTMLSQGTVSFNSDGTLKNVNNAATPTGNLNLTIPWTAASGLSTPQNITLNLGTVGGTSGLTQYNAPSALNGSNVDGSAFGSVTGVTIAKDGTLTAQFSNGLSQDVYKIPLATFTNPDGLGQVSGNAYVSTRNSGAADINLAKSGMTGAINSQSLEGSTVDLATEFTNLITTQRAYSASARIITTADQMLQQLEQLPTN